MTKLGEMAHGLDKYRSSIRNATLGALGEYFKFRIASDADLHLHREKGHLISHWDLEWRRLLTKGLAPDLSAQVKFKKSGRLNVALSEVNRLRTTENIDSKYAEWARRKVNKDFDVHIAKPVTANPQPFWDEVHDIIRTILDPDYEPSE